ncbi:MAG: MEMO1 family protein [Candidatus Micrarchaeia archaeon]
MREAVFAGSFYPKDSAKLSFVIDDFLKRVDNKKITDNLLSAVAPHAGYIYSGQTAAYTYKSISLILKKKNIDTFVIIGPNHTGLGKPISVSMDDWKTPLGIIKNDIEVSKMLIKNSNYIEADEIANKEEHSIEVQLPFLQKITKEPKCVFICIGDQSYESAVLLSNAIYDSAKALNREVFLIASSDMNHYESEDIAKEKDMHILDKLKKLDIKNFYLAIDETNDSMCGYGAAATAALFAEKKGAKEGVVLDYTNSGILTNDYNSVVSYASIIFK